MILKIIDDVMKEEAQEQRAKVTGKGITGWRSSGLGTCMRGRYLDRLLSGTGIKPELEPRVLRVFEMGNQVEKWLMEKIKKNKEYQVLEQIEMHDPELNLTGHLDAFLYIDGKGKEEDGQFIVECKSKHSKAFWYMEKKGEGAQVHHKMQLHSYLYMLNKYGGNVINEAGAKTLGIDAREGKLIKGSILYVSKDDMALLEYPVYLNDTELEKAWKFEIETLNACWKAKTAPPAPVTGSWQEKYCEYCKIGLCATLDDKKVKELFDVKDTMPEPVSPAKIVFKAVPFLRDPVVGDRVYLREDTGLSSTPEWPVYKSIYSCAGTIKEMEGRKARIIWDNGKTLTLFSAVDNLWQEVAITETK